MDQTAFLLEFQDLIESLPGPSQDKFLQLYLARAKNPLVGVGLAAFLGCLGINRFYVGQTTLGVVKLVCGLFVIILTIILATNPDDSFSSYYDLTLVDFQFAAWIVVDTFLMGGLVARKNLQIAQDIKSTMSPAAIWQHRQP